MSKPTSSNRKEKLKSLFRKISVIPLVFLLFMGCSQRQELREQQPLFHFEYPSYTRHLKGFKICLDPGHGGQGHVPDYKRGPTGVREAEVEVLILVNPWLSCLNQYLITPHSSIIKKILNKETPPETSKKLTERLNVLFDLLNLIVLSKSQTSSSKDNLKKVFNESKENQLHIQIEPLTKCFKAFIEEKIIHLAKKIKDFSEKYDHNTQKMKNNEPISILEDFILFIGRYYFIMSSMMYLHKGSFPEYKALGDIKKMMPHFSKPEAWQPNPSNDWKIELKKYTEPIYKHKT